MSRVLGGTLLDSFLFIESDTLDPDRITAALGLTPVIAEPPGRIEIDLDGTSLDPLPGRWIARTAHRLESTSVDEHLHFLLALLAPHRAMVHKLAASPRGRVWLGLEIAPATPGTVGSLLDAALHRTIQDLRANVWEVAPGEIPGGAVPPPV